MWYLNDKPVTEDDIDGYLGFVYMITNLEDGRRYIGKKLLKFKKTRKPLKGKKRKRRSLIESDWRDYFGSSDTLKEDVAKLGPDKFKREILRLCKTKGECNYHEMKYQILNEVLESDGWYNDYIGGRIHRSHIK